MVLGNQDAVLEVKILKGFNLPSGFPPSTPAPSPILPEGFESDFRLLKATGQDNRPTPHIELGVLV